MTHDEWLASNDPQAMLVFLRDGGKVTERKKRLFACACVRRVGDVQTEPRTRRAVAAAEQEADEVVATGQVPWAFGTAESLMAVLPVDPNPFSRLRAVAAGVWAAFHPGVDLLLAQSPAAWPSQAFQADVEQLFALEKAAQAVLLRDLFGDPFTSPPAAPAVLEWNAGMIPQLARSIYEQGNFQDLPVLADALEESGTKDEVLLQHLRGGGVHARGCWALDAILHPDGEAPGREARGLQDVE